MRLGVREAGGPQHPNVDALGLGGHTAAGVQELGGKGASLLLPRHGDVGDGHSVLEPAHHLVLDAGVAVLLHLD